LIAVLRGIFVNPTANAEKPRRHYPPRRNSLMEHTAMGARNAQVVNDSPIDFQTTPLRKVNLVSIGEDHHVVELRPGFAARRAQVVVVDPAAWSRATMPAGSCAALRFR
jgi:hypothetical protein